jgi:hypothetical protein
MIVGIMIVNIHYSWVEKTLRFINLHLLLLTNVLQKEDITGTPASV